MSTMQIRVDEDLKQEATLVLKKMGINPSDAIRQLLQYVVDNGKMPFASVSLVVAETDNDEDIIQLVKERIANPAARIRVNIDEI